mgnify:CR=1 FL=1
MIKLLILDLDGTLIDAKELHFKALNEALRFWNSQQNNPIPNLEISEEDKENYEARRTIDKLNRLSGDKGLPIEAHTEINTLKQRFTYDYIDDLIKLEDYKKQRLILSYLHNKYQIHCATNCKINSARLMLAQSGLLQYIDYLLPGDYVTKPKPHPLCFLQCMVIAEVEPREVLIIEDSPVGLMAASKSGAYVMKVDTPFSYSLEDILLKIEQAEHSEFWDDFKQDFK